MTWPYEPQSPDQQPDGLPGAPADQPPTGWQQPFPRPYQPSAQQQPYAQPTPPSSQPYAPPAQPAYSQPFQPAYQQPFQGAYPPAYQTTAPYPQPYGQPYRPYLGAPVHRRSRAMPWAIAVSVLAFVGLMVGVAIPVARANLDPCGPEHAPLGASRTAVAYVHAVNAARPQWLAMSQTIASQGNKVRPDQMVVQLEADQTFLTALKGISFPAAQQPAAQSLVAAVEQYDAFVQTASENPGYLNAHPADDRALNDTRAAASSELRRELRLPAARCSYNRP